MDRHWVWPNPIEESVNIELGEFPPVARQLLHSRGLATRDLAHTFLRPDDSLQGKAFEMLGMEEAVDRLVAARQAGERVVVYGDYDVDGVTATALLFEVLRRLEFDAHEYIPNRFDEGYGLHTDALAGLRQGGASLVVSVDCGIRSLAEANAARQLGLDLIVTDHHQPGPALPDALVILCPRREADPYPFKDLAGVGLAYKLAEALTGRLEAPGPVACQDLVALGTIADLAPLVGENRSLVAQGLRQINDVTRGTGVGRPGLAALARRAGVAPGNVTATSVAFGLAPRLNAAGRLDSALTSFRLLTTLDAREAEVLAGMLDDANRRRQTLTAETVMRARELALASGSTPSLLVAADASFNEGIVGLAAARLAEEFYRPAIVIVEREGDVRGSARSIPEFHITRALDECADLLLEYGGHAMAAGFTAGREQAPALLQRLRAIADSSLGAQDLRPTLEIDAEAGFEALDEELMRFLDALEPTGYGNRRPILGSRRVEIISSRAVGAEGKHLKLSVRDRGRVRDAIAFRQGKLHGRLPGRVDLAYQLGRNSYLGVETLELNVVDVRPAEETGAQSTKR